MPTFQEYADEVRKCTPPLNEPLEDALILGALGLTGEAGEVSDQIKKFMYHNHELRVYHLEEELGDVLWYLNLIAAAVGSTLEQVAKKNMEKLAKRYPNGFSTAASIARADEK